MTIIHSTLLCLDGGHGVGTTTHADALAVALRALGRRAEVYHHPRHPDGCNGTDRVAWYVAQRSALADHLWVLGDAAPEVIVMDRGPLSGVVYVRAFGIDDDGVALADCARWHALGLRTRQLHAAWSSVSARLRERGEDPHHAVKEHQRWVRAIGDTTLDDYVTGYVSTDQPADRVTALLVDWAQRMIRAAAVERAR